jgi:hypothetical protein
MKERPFKIITNEDIYNTIEANHQTHVEKYNAIITRLDITNGKVKLTKWIATTALTIALIGIGYAFQVMK